MRINWFANSSFLGIAIGERSLTVVEVCESRGAWEVRRCAQFELPADNPGEALGKFLRENRFSASQAVVGLPARWVVAREKDIPPADAAMLADVLRLQAERLFSSELKDLIFDYAGTPDPNAPGKVLLLAMPRQQLDRAVAMVETAGLSALGVMPSTLALASAGAPADNLLLNLASEVVELAVCSSSGPRLLRHLPIRTPDLISTNGTRASAVSALANEMKRAAATSFAGRSIVLWDGAGLTSEDTASIAQHTGAEVHTQADLSSLGISVLDDAPACGSAFAPAVALAISGATGKLPVDFLHSKLAPVRKRRFGRGGAWAIALSATLLVVLAAMVWDLRARQHELAGLQSTLAVLQPNIQAAENTTDKITAARGWFSDGRPPTLEALREITLAFRDDEQIYVTAFTIKDNRTGTLAGRSSDQKNVLSILDRLKKSRNFTDVKLLDMRDAGGTSREVSFSLSFTYSGV